MGSNRRSFCARAVLVILHCVPAPRTRPHGSAVVAPHNFEGILMARRSTSWFDLWMAPSEAMPAMRKAAETASVANDVIAKRMPAIMNAMVSPWTADYAELSLMVSEKVSAIATSSRSAARSQKRLSGAVDGQLAALQRIASAGWLTPAEWWEVGERNLTIATTLM